MKKIAFAIAVIVLAGCADLDVWFYQRRMAGDTRTVNEKAKADSPREPARGDQPYSPRR